MALPASLARAPLPAPLVPEIDNFNILQYHYLHHDNSYGMAWENNSDSVIVILYILYVLTSKTNQIT